MDTPPRNIVFAEAFDSAAVRKMQSIGNVTVLDLSPQGHVEDSCDQDRLIEAVRDCEALLIRTHTRVTRALLEGAPRLRVIGRGGAGLDNVDLQAARERGITVVHTPDAATEAVADLTVGFIVALVRGILAGDTMVRVGSFAEARRHLRARELSELTLGIVGLGRIGKAVARRCRHGLGMAILYNDIANPGLLDFAAEAVDKEGLYRASDVVSLHVPLTSDTRHLISAETLRKLKPGAILINTSRGGVVDGDALAEALRSGALGGAGLDVFDPEPPPVNHPLLAAPNTVFTPHLGARTDHALGRMNAVVEDVIRVLNGEKPHYPAWQD